jgi:hypothetical protein
MVEHLIGIGRSDFHGHIVCQLPCLGALLFPASGIENDYHPAFFSAPTHHRGNAVLCLERTSILGLGRQPHCPDQLHVRSRAHGLWRDECTSSRRTTRTSAGQPCTAVAGYTLCKWFAFSSTDMVNWTDHGAVASWSTFSWAGTAAWAPQAIPRNGKFYAYVPLNNKSGATVIGVGVATSPTGPYTDAIGKPLVTAGCSGGTGDIDPTVFIDDDGQAYLYFGRSVPGYVKLNSDMISYTGSVQCPTVNTPKLRACSVRRRLSLSVRRGAVDHEARHNLLPRLRGQQHS